MNLQNVIDNYGKIDKGVRVFTFLYFFVFFILLACVAIQILKFDAPFLYTQDGSESVIPHGVFIGLSALTMLPLVFFIPFDIFIGLYGFVKISIHFIFLAAGMEFIPMDMANFQINPLVESFMRILYDSGGFVFNTFVVFCVIIPTSSRYIMWCHRDDKCQMKT